MDQAEKAKHFAVLHVKGDPLVLYNAWDAASARAVLEAGAKAIATSSAALAAAQGYPDREEIPLSFVYEIISRITQTIEAPVSVDFEGGYSELDSELAANVTRLLALGIVGINFEDRVIRGSGLYSQERQAQRISVVREAAERMSIPLFINARTDVFLEHPRDPKDVLERAVSRAKAYADAGASGFFIPGLAEEGLIGRICDGVALPVNVMLTGSSHPRKRLSDLGVARISYGPAPFRRAMDVVRREAVWAYTEHDLSFGGGNV